jgi:hypothetical protein
MNIIALWDKAQCSLVEAAQCFRALKMEAVSTSEKLVFYEATLLSIQDGFHLYSLCHKKVKTLPVLAMQALREREDVAPTHS